jgi:hypothetical protein
MNIYFVKLPYDHYVHADIFHLPLITTTTTIASTTIIT